MINDELIEYLPNNPGYVRIKGADHPLLQSCLVEGTEYVASSALRNFHPAIYEESASHIHNLIISAIQRVSSQDFSSIVQSTSQLTKNENSPATTLDFQRNRHGSIFEPIQRTENQIAAQDIRTAEWEWLVIGLYKAMGIPYTRKHAKVMDDVTQFMNDIGIALSSQGLNDPAEIIQYLQKAYWSDRGKDLRERIVKIGIQNRNDDRKKPETLEDATGKYNCSTTCSCEEQSGDATEQKCLQGPFLTAAHCKPTAPENQESIFPQPAPSDDSYQFSKQNACKKVPEMGDAEREKKRNGKFTHVDQSRFRYQYGTEQEEKRQFEKQKQNRFFDHLFGPIKKFSRRKTSPVTKQSQLVGGFDFVPAFRCPGWPKIAREWTTRERKWPSPYMVFKVAQEGFHLVAKPPKNGGKGDRDFRISFSYSEYLLSQEMNDIQRECYRCLKKYHRAYLSKESKSLVTFHLKNLFLQTIEETGAEVWTESNRSKCMMMLFDNLFEALEKKFLHHFFVRSWNIFGTDYIENPKILESLAGVLTQIRNNPVQFGTPLMKDKHSKFETAVKENQYIPHSDTDIAKTGEHGAGEITDFPCKGCANTKGKRQESPCQERSSIANFRYHDLKDFFLSVSKELIDMAFNEHTTDCILEALDPLERSLVDGLKEIEKIGIVRVDEFPKMFDISWDLAFYRMLVSSEQNMRRRVLEGIQSVVEVCRYVFKQDDFAPGNEDAIIKRMHDANSENCFDLNRYIPAGSGTQFVLNFFNGLQLSEASQENVDFEIPLD
ncbi:uncharacterized protein [Montipora foliosa]|uniref:uncharacterized protein n=1 Tax=Montipora foliosa TaxID=591990 RepID=UPI0035F0FE33